MKINEVIINEAEQFVTGLLKSETPEIYTYHTLNHTQDVFKNALLIGIREKLDEEEMSILSIAALFHDVGYLKKYKGHEEESAEIATRFLEQHGVDEYLRTIVAESIRATAFPQSPESRVAKLWTLKR